MRDIEKISNVLRTTYPDIVIEQLTVLHPGADDDGIWYFRRSGGSTEIQLESSSGNCPFLVESSGAAVRLTAATPQEAVNILVRGLDAAAPAA